MAMVLFFQMMSIMSPVLNFTGLKTSLTSSKLTAALTRKMANHFQVHSLHVPFQLSWTNCSTEEHTVSPLRCSIAGDVIIENQNIFQKFFETAK